MGPGLITNGSRSTVNQAARLQLLYSQPGLITNGSRSTVNQAAGFGNRTTAKCKPATARSTSTATNQSDSRLQLLYSQPGVITNGSRSTVNQALLATVGKAAGNSGDTRV